MSFTYRHRPLTWIVAAALIVGLPLVGTITDRLRSRMQRAEVAEALTGGDAALAPAIFRRYGCAGCHTIPGIPGADGKVGGALSGLREQVYIGGVLNNTPRNLVQWIVAPRHFSPRTVMPATGITEEEARHLAAYLYRE
jgi:cytochrome c2